MRKWSRYAVGVVAIAGWLALVVSAGAETCKLEARQLDAAQSRMRAEPAAYWFQATRPQTFYMSVGGPGGTVQGSSQEGVPEFSHVIKKEPSQYNAEQPLRGVAKFGSLHFGFVLDTAARPAAPDEAKTPPSAPATEEGVETPKETQLAKIPSYQRLYFDVNHNGDLTDDKVIESSMTQNLSASYAHSAFPSTDVTIELDGVPIQYAFAMTAYAYAHTADQWSANAMISAAAYREGELVVDGKKRRVVIVDNNSNGRYDDVSGIDESVQVSDGSVYPKTGDTLFVMDPDHKLDFSTNPYANPYDASTNDIGHYVGPRISLDGRLFDLKITPTGDELTLTPTAAPVGYVVNPNVGYRAVVYGEQGMLKIVADPAGKACLPAGKWRLMSYTIEKAAAAEPADEKAKEGAQSGSLFDAVRQLIGGAPRSPEQMPTIVSARGTKDYPAVEVKQDATVDMPFGEPYRPVVTLGYAEGMDRASLSMELVGSAGEVCGNMIVKGQRPGKPKLTISTEKGEVVETGNFEYG